jgi:hypothetical protein
MKFYQYLPKITSHAGILSAYLKPNIKVLFITLIYRAQYLVFNLTRKQKVGSFVNTPTRLSNIFSLSHT